MSDLRLGVSGLRVRVSAPGPRVRVRVRPRVRVAAAAVQGHVTAVDQLGIK